MQNVGLRAHRPATPLATKGIKCVQSCTDVYTSVQLRIALHSQVKILTLFNRRRLLRFITTFKIVNDINFPKQLEDKLIKRSSIRSRSLRDDSLLNVPNAKSGFGEKTFEFAAVRDWNSLPRDIRTITNLSTFKSKLFEFLLQEDHNQHKCSLA